MSKKVKVRALTAMAGATLWRKGEVREIDTKEATNLLNAKYVEIVHDKAVERAVKQEQEPRKPRTRKKQ